MPAMLSLRNNSVRRRIVQRRRLERIAARVCAGELDGGSVEISVLLCDDSAITALNRKYRRKNAPTDVLSFEQENTADSPGVRALGDIVISLETAERNCGGDRTLVRREVDMLFCHGLLHLLGYDHHTAGERAEMRRKQAQYLYTNEATAWDFGPKANHHRPAHLAGPGRNRRFGR